MTRPLLELLAATVLWVATARAGRTDNVPAQFGAWEGLNGYFLTGAALAADTNGDGSADTRLTSTSFDVTAVNFPPTATLVSAYLYWGGTQTESGTADLSVGLAIPGLASRDVTADVVYFSDGGSMSYDMFLSRADVTTLFPSTGAAIIGRYTVDNYVGSITNRSTDNASTALLLVFEDPAAPRRRIVAHDGLLTMERSSHLVSPTGFDASASPAATLAYYTLDGDIGNPTDAEHVRVTGQPSGLSVLAEDSLNPRDNPMNRTINTALPPQTGTVGVDIDRFDISAAVASHDSSLDIRYGANTDKWWLALSVAEMTLSSQCVACDLNVDGTIDNGDFALWTAYYGASSASGVLIGDLNADGRVGLRDLIQLRAHLGETVVHFPSPEAGAAVPEPSTLLGLLLTGVLIAVAAKKKATAVEKAPPRSGKVRETSRR
jgi:hypothetical protein